MMLKEHEIKEVSIYGTYCKECANMDNCVNCSVKVRARVGNRLRLVTAYKALAELEIDSCIVEICQREEKWEQYRKQDFAQVTKTDIPLPCYMCPCNKEKVKKQKVKEELKNAI